ncbi:hypothetical protein Oscil6304_0618 [Oscillatoria acuminata PCC 6304]|uniref:Uncharacterized protein n=1 Tax=Oscillatoria acuminata PCC 6304 TaxID=56110 RepID=K9TD74_9CYAN|nr:hypothetical protein Oscil6304_0618 [Oscillatoria acuminata PCC 6304]
MSRKCISVEGDGEDGGDGGEGEDREEYTSGPLPLARGGLGWGSPLLN